MLRLRQLAALTRRMDGAEPGPDGSVDKLLMSATDQQLLHTALGILGPAASLGEDVWYSRYLRCRASTILGGTAQIQRNTWPPGSSASAADPAALPRMVVGRDQLGRTTALRRTSP